MRDELRQQIERIIEKINVELPGRLATPFELKIVHNGTREPMGQYWSAFKTDKAIVAVNMNARDTWGAARHELGHHVWESYLTDNSREKWTTMIWRDGKDISDYAQTNSAEGFAEAFMIYFQDREYLPSRVKRFIEE